MTPDAIEAAVLAASWAGCMGAVGAGAFVAGVLIGARNLKAAVLAAAAPLVSVAMKGRGKPCDKS